MCVLPRRVNLKPDTILKTNYDPVILKLPYSSLSTIILYIKVKMMIIIIITMSVFVSEITEIRKIYLEMK